MLGMVRVSELRWTASLRELNKSSGDASSRMRFWKHRCVCTPQSAEADVRSLSAGAETQVSSFQLKEGAQSSRADKEKPQSSKFVI